MDVWIGDPLRNAKLGDALRPLVEQWRGAPDRLDAFAKRCAMNDLAFERRGDHGWWRTAAWDGAPPSARVLLVGHHDGDAGPPGMASIWTALVSSSRDRHPIGAVVVGDELAANEASRPWLEAIGRGAGAALVLSPGLASETIITERKGLIRAKSALEAVAARARALADASRAITAHVTEDAIDLRFAWPTDETALVDALAGDDDALTIVRRSPMTKAPGAGALAVRYGRCAGVDGPRPDEAPLQEDSSSANVLAAIGVPTLDGLGPLAGASDSLEVASLGRRTRALVRFLVRRVTW